MNFNKDNGNVSFGNGLVLSSTLAKQELFLINGLFWEAWPDNGDDTVNYRAVFNTKKQ
ncbi:hypothetical protein ACQV2B_01030 [Pantoea allii]|uniref:hypothetical protein n=1 Tax=Pantoea allii TaxID=574096 RepID=UPI003D31FF14